MEALSAEERGACNSRRDTTGGKQRSRNRWASGLEGNVGEGQSVGRDTGAGRSAAVVVVVDLDDAIFHAHGIVGAALVERREETIAATNDSTGIGAPAEADTRLNTVGDILDGARVEGRDRIVVGVVFGGRGGELDVVAHANVDGEVLIHLPGIFGEAIEHLHPEVVGTSTVARIHLVNGLDEAGVVIASVGIGVARLAAE